MTKRILALGASAAVASACLLAQGSPLETHFQQPGWMAARGGEPAQLDMHKAEGQTGPVPGKPFSATELRHSVQILSDGTHVDRTDASLYYRDDRGRMRSESPKHVLIYDPVAGLVFNLDVAAKTYQKSPVRSEAAVTIAATGTGTSVRSQSGNGRRPPSNGVQPVTEDLPAQAMNGVNVKGSRITSTIPVGTFGNDRELKVVSERWYSDDLKVLVKSFNSDPRFGTTTYELVGIVQNSPNPALFQPPAEYKLKDAQQAK